MNKNKPRDMGRHLCDSCALDFLTCPAVHILFGIDIDPSLRGADADRIHECDAYERKETKDEQG